MSILLSSWLLAILMAPALGTLGCFLVWRRMAFFGEALAHASLLGLACSLAYKINLSFGILVSGLIVCVLLLVMKHNREMPRDAWLNLIAHVMMGAGLVIVSLANIDVDLEHYLLGEWLETSTRDLFVGGGVMMAVIVGLFIIRKPLLASTAQDEIATAEQLGYSGGDWRMGWRGNFIFLGLLTLFVAVSVQTVGLLLLNTLMIIPALIARQWSNTPYSMIGGSILIAIIIMSGGLGMAILFGVPASPSAAIYGGALFVLSLLLKKFLAPSLK